MLSYDVAMDEDPESFTDQCDVFLARGYEAQGGVAVMINTADVFNHPKVFYYQAFIGRFEDDDEDEWEDD